MEIRFEKRTTEICVSINISQLDVLRMVAESAGFQNVESYLVHIIDCITDYDMGISDSEHAAAAELHKEIMLQRLCNRVYQMQHP